MPKQPLVVCVTGAAGQIGYAITPMICNGDMFGTRACNVLAARCLFISPAPKPKEHLVLVVRVFITLINKQLQLSTVLVRLSEHEVAAHWYSRTP